MDIISTQLTHLQKKLFKLLPMREDSDRGVENYLSQHIEYLQTQFEGAIGYSPELLNEEGFVDVFNTVVYLRNHANIPFKKWRSLVLASMTSLGSIIEARKEV